MTSGLTKLEESKEGEGEKLQKRLEWNEDRIRHWLKLGAQPSKPVARLLDRVSTTPPSLGERKRENRKVTDTLD